MDLKIKTLSQIHSGDDVGFLSPAVNPGYHCPLYGVVMCQKYMKDLAVLILGETECCWNAYNQHLSEGPDSRFYTYSMTDLDIIYGSREGLCRGVKKLWERDHFQALMLVSSCVPELTGEDLEKLAAGCDIPVPVLCTHTSHYNSRGYFDGITHFYNGLLPLVVPPAATERKAAILGSRYDHMEKSEVPAALQAAGIRVYVPGSVEDIRSLSSAMLNIVVDVTALELAQKLQQQFGVPYVRVDRLCSPDRIYRAYEQIDAIAGTALAPARREQLEDLRSRMEKLKTVWQGKRFVCAAPFCLPFETTEFFCSMGMHPAWIVMRDIYPGEEAPLQRLLQAGEDCPVSSFASLGNLENRYREIGADLYFGFITAMSLPEKSLLINPAPCGSMTGFSFPQWILSSMERYERR